MTEPAARMHADAPRAAAKQPISAVTTPVRAAAIPARRAGGTVPVPRARASIQSLRRDPVTRPVGDPPAPIGAPIAVIRRAPLDVAQVLTAVDSLGYFKGRLDEQTAGQKRDSRAGFTDEDVRDRVRKILVEHQDMFGKDDAMSMAIAVDWVAKVVAEQLYDSSLKPAIAAHLLERYKDDLKAAMPNKGRRTKDLAKAKAIVSTDALSLYLHEERKLHNAAWDIHDAAASGGLGARALFDALLQKFQAEMASFSLGTVEAQVDQRAVYNQSESTGNVSTNYVKELFGDTVSAEPSNKMPKRAGGDGLQFTASTLARIDALRQAVDATLIDGAKDPRPASVADRRAKLFTDINERDRASRATRESAVRAALMAAPWSLSGAKADKLIAKLKSGMTSLPLTITHKAKDRLPINANVDARDSSRAGQTAEVDVQGKNFPSPGKWTGNADRGEDYMQFRSWKDRMMTGDTGMSGAEMPVFGAVNVNWKKYKGSETAGAPDILERDNKPRRKEKRAELVGQNYYGDLHIVLDRKKLAGRVVYTATDHGQPHADPFLAFADFLVGSQGEYNADITRLKRDGVPKFSAATAVQRPEFAQMVVATILGSVKAAAMNLPFEIMIHGGVDWATDAVEIWVAPSVKVEYVDKLRRWSKATGGPKIKVIEPPSDSTVSLKAGLAASGVKHAKSV